MKQLSPVEVHYGNRADYLWQLWQHIRPQLRSVTFEIFVWLILLYILYVAMGLFCNF